MNKWAPRCLIVLTDVPAQHVVHVEKLHALVVASEGRAPHTAQRYTPRGFVSVREDAAVSTAILRAEMAATWAGALAHPTMQMPNRSSCSRFSAATRRRAGGGGGGMATVAGRKMVAAVAVEGARRVGGLSIAARRRTRAGPTVTTFAARWSPGGDGIVRDGSGPVATQESAPLTNPTLSRAPLRDLIAAVEAAGGYVHPALRVGRRGGDAAAPRGVFAATPIPR